MAGYKKSLNKKSTTTKRNSRDWDGDRRKKKAAKINPVEIDLKGPAEHTMKWQEEQTEKTKAYIRKCTRRNKDRGLQSDIDDQLPNIKQTARRTKVKKTKSKWAAKVHRVHKKEEEIQIGLIDMRKYPSVDRRIGSYKWILTMKNVRTKFQALSPLSSKDEDEVVHVFFNMWVKLGCSLRVRFHKGKEFSNTLMRNLASALNVKFESNRMPGSIERSKSEIKRLLSQKMLDCQTQQWHLLLGFVEMAVNSRYRPNINASPVEYHLGRRFPCRLQGTDSLRRFMAVYAPAFLPKTTNRNGHSTKISEEIVANLEEDMDNPVDDDLEEAIEALESAIQDFESKRAALIPSVQMAVANHDFDAVARLSCEMKTFNEEINKLQDQRQALLDKRTKLLNSPHPKLDTLHDYNIIGMDSYPNTSGVQEGSNLNGIQSD